MKKPILITTILTLSVFACNKKEVEDTKPQDLSRKTQLIGKDWKIKTHVHNGSVLRLDTCILDDIYYHFTDATNAYTDNGLIKCDPSEPQRWNLTWSLIDNESRFVVTNLDGGKDTFNIISLTEGEFKIGKEVDVMTFRN